MKSLCKNCVHNCTDKKNNICNKSNGIWCNAEYGRVIVKKMKGCKNFEKRKNE